MGDFYPSAAARRTATAIGFGALGVIALGITLPTLAQADTLIPYSGPPLVSGPGVVPIVTAGGGPAYQLTSLSSGSPTYSGLYLELSTPMSVNSLVQLSADYVMTEGTFGGGAPRFSLVDGSGNEAYIDWGTPSGFNFSDPNFGNTTFANTGNYADLTSTDVRVYSNDFAGVDLPNTGETWAEFVAAVDANGSTILDNEIADVSLDLDGGFTGTEQMDVRDYDVNGEVLSPAPAPEPGSLALLGTALLALGLWRRRKKT